MDSASWFVRPGTRRVVLAEDQWLLLKRRLTAGEYRAHLKRCTDVDEDGTRRINSLDHGRSLIIAYLVDWSLADYAPVAGVDAFTLGDILDTLAHDRFTVIKLAAEAHVEAMDEERNQEKKTPAGESPLPATSPSPSDVAGV